MDAYKDIERDNYRACKEYEKGIRELQVDNNDMDYDDFEELVDDEKIASEEEEFEEECERLLAID